MTVCSVLKNMRRVIANVYKNTYRKNRIGGEPGSESVVAVDETLILHDISGNQQWFLGAIETEKKEVRLEFVPNRNASTIKKFFLNHIMAGTHITHDGWQGYCFLKNDDSVWTDEEHNHGHGDFGHGKCSTSHIENYWSRLKGEIEKIYGIMPKLDTIYYIREMEFRLDMEKTFKTFKQKETMISILLRECYKLNKYVFFSDNFILNFDNY